MTARELVTHAASKATSARVLCVVGALGMWYVMRATLSPDTHTVLITTVILSYFNRADRSTNS
jgi:hypothetical protein